MGSTAATRAFVRGSPSLIMLKARTSSSRFGRGGGRLIGWGGAAPQPARRPLGGVCARAGGGVARALRAVRATRRWPAPAPPPPPPPPPPLPPPRPVCGGETV